MKCCAKALQAHVTVIPLHAHTVHGSVLTSTLKFPRASFQDLKGDIFTVHVPFHYYFQTMWYVKVNALSSHKGDSVTV